MKRLRAVSSLAVTLSGDSLLHSESVEKARHLENRGLFLRAARQWRAVLFQQPGCGDYITEQIARCIDMSNIKHASRIEAYDRETDVRTVHDEIDKVYRRMEREGKIAAFCRLIHVRDD